MRSTVDYDDIRRLVLSILEGEGVMDAVAESAELAEQVEDMASASELERIRKAHNKRALSTEERFSALAATLPGVLARLQRLEERADKAKWDRDGLTSQAKNGANRIGNLVVHVADQASAIDRQLGALGERVAETAGVASQARNGANRIENMVVHVADQASAIDRELGALGERVAETDGRVDSLQNLVEGVRGAVLATMDTMEKALGLLRSGR